ncbi:MAG TPA: ThuA domain-containing protein [Sphingopyxis sp.]|nr:ThuA domain-containing protein [Sphingopyxis sp.]HMP43545.1 ThuA domain-containing protein [Sphingopyxis sp.]HMQ17625.1 ThuA domain-containing protein [Sphingopyxis sp.]
MSAARRLLVLSGGHPYDADAFAGLLASLDGWTVTHLIHPEAEAAVAAGAAEEADAILFYDMPGYGFASGKMTTRPPSPAYRRAIPGHFARGRGAVAMHHALAGWAEWPEWADMLGGRFLYAPGEANGEAHLDSGYLHDVRYDAVVIDPDHPVTAGLPPRFPLCDELYLAPVWGAATPLLRADHDFVRGNFYSAAEAVAGRMFSNTGWNHRPESDLIAWEKPVGAGRLVYLQPGDGPAAYADPHLRRLIANALAHVAAA